MRTLIVSEFMTLDGVIQAPGGKDEDRAPDHQPAADLIGKRDPPLRPAPGRCASRAHPHTGVRGWDGAKRIPRAGGARPMKDLVA